MHQSLPRFQTGADHRYIQPYRGFLLQLIPVGCTPDVPVLLSDLAILVEHNQSHATYRQTGPLSLVEDRHYCALIGRELHSVAGANIMP